MKTVAVFLTLALIGCQAVTHEEAVQQWAEFQQTHEKTYASSTEAKTRFDIFKSNLDKIEAHNKLYDQGKETYTMGTNQFTDMTSEEFLEYVAMSSQGAPEFDNVTMYEAPVEGYNAPPDWDWGHHGAITGIKDQGQCGACWAFASTGALEGALKIHRNHIVSLSEGELLDCARPGNAGCGGGNPVSTYNYVRDHGVVSENDYHYVSHQQNCQRGNKKEVTRVRGIVQMPAGNEGALRDSLAAHGPIAASFLATANLQHYKNGVLYDKLCEHRTDINHYATLIGYGSAGNNHFWIMKNSWGKHWGDNGFFKSARDHGNHCNIASWTYYPTL